MKSIFLFLTIILGSLLTGFGQAIDLSVQAYPVGQWQNDRMTAIPADQALQQHCRKRVATLVPQTGADLQWQRDELVERPGQGWQYLTYWQQGDAQVVASFNALLRAGKLQVLEVGSYQMCRCIGCTKVALAKDGPGCACEAQDDCTFLVGETLH